MENTIALNKIGFQEEKSFIVSEMRRAEEEAVDAKIKYAEVSTDKDFFQFKYNKIIKELKKRNIDLKI